MEISDDSVTAMLDTARHSDSTTIPASGRVLGVLLVSLSQR
jgi:hypothetical protein